MDELLGDPEGLRAYAEELLFTSIQHEILVLLEKNSFDRRYLAKRLAVSEGRISEMLSRPECLNIRTLARIGSELGAQWDLRAMWPDVPRNLIERPADEDVETTPFVGIGNPIAEAARSHRYRLAK